MRNTHKKREIQEPQAVARLLVPLRVQNTRTRQMQVPPCRLFCAAPPVVAVPRELLLFAVAVALGHSTASFVISGGALSLGSDPMVRCVGEEAATRARVAPTGAARRWDTTSEPTAPGWRRRRRGRVRILRGATRPSGHEWSVPRPLLLPQGCRRRACVRVGVYLYARRVPRVPSLPRETEHKTTKRQNRKIKPKAQNTKRKRKTKNEKRNMKT